jgi:hypothetical protein
VRGTERYTWTINFVLCLFLTLFRCGCNTYQLEGAHGVTPSRVLVYWVSHSPLLNIVFPTFCLCFVLLRFCGGGSDAVVERGEAKKGFCDGGFSSLSWTILFLALHFRFCTHNGFFFYLISFYSGRLWSENGEGDVLRLDMLSYT